jgi:hypothetical protein
MQPAPPEIKHAHKIDEKINEHVGTQDLCDSEFDGDGKGSSYDSPSDGEVEIVEKSTMVALLSICP